MVDYIFAYAFGNVFQDFTISADAWAFVLARLCRGHQGGHAVADRLASRHVRLHGVSPIYIFRSLIGVALCVDMVEFWFMMQIATIFGFLTAYPVNWWLIRAGEKM